MPPRAFLAGWCGGLSLGELLGVLAWLGLNAFWLGAFLQRTLKDGMTWTQQLDRWGGPVGPAAAPGGVPVAGSAGAAASAAQSRAAC